MLATLDLGTVTDEYDVCVRVFIGRRGALLLVDPGTQRGRVAG